MGTNTIEKWEYSEKNPQGVMVASYEVAAEDPAPEKPTLADIKAKLDEIAALVAAL